MDWLKTVWWLVSIHYTGITERCAMRRYLLASRFVRRKFSTCSKCFTSQTNFFGDWPFLALLVTRMSKTRCLWALWLTGFGWHSQLDGRSVNSLFCTMRVWSPININTDCYFWHRLSVWIVSRLTRQYETEIQVIIGYYIKKRYSHPRSRYLHFI